MPASPSASGPQTKEGVVSPWTQTVTGPSSGPSHR